MLRSSLIAMLAATVLLSGCGGGGGSPLVDALTDEATDRAKDAVDTAVDDATDRAKDGVDSAVDDATDRAKDAVDDATDRAKDVAGDLGGVDTAPYARSSDFGAHWGHAATGVEAAYIRGYEGLGVIVAVVDDGVAHHSELAGRVLPGFNAFTNDPNGTPAVNHACDGLGGCDTGTHGTLISGVVAAARDGTGAHGVAPDASIFGINIDARENDGLFSGQEISNALAFNAAIAAGARIFNHSYASYYDLEQQALFESGAGGIHQRLLEVVQAGGIHVYAVGNDGANQPSMESLWPVWTPDLEGGVLAVAGAVRDQDTGDLRLASYSNHCGDAKEWCLSAPTGDFGAGERFTGLVPSDEAGLFHTPSDPDQDGLINSIGGTSSAAPYVAGALALLQQAFPELSGKELGAILLDTAQDLGDAGTDDVFGRGFVDIEEAFKPQGEAVLATGATVASATTRLSDTNLVLGGVLASGLALEGKSIVFFDQYGRAFPIEASALMTEESPFPDSLARLGQALDSVERSRHKAVLLDDRMSFAFAQTGAASAQMGASSMGSLLNMVSAPDADRSGNGFQSHFDGAFLGFASDARAAVVQHQLSPNAALSVTMGSSRSRTDFSADQDTDLATVDFAYKLNSDTAIGLSAGMVRETGGVLGSTGSGAFSLAEQSDTKFVEGRFVRRLSDRIALVGEAALGQTEMGASRGYLTFDGPVTSAEARMGLSLDGVARAGDQLTVSGGMPLTMVGGKTIATLPTGRDVDGNVLYTVIESNPSDQVPVELRLDYAIPLTDDTTLGLSSAMRHDEGHDIYGDIAIGLRMQF